MNIFQDVRKAKKEDRFNTEAYSEAVCTEYEEQTLGSAITYKPFWDVVQAGEVVSTELNLINIREKVDKNGNMMAFVECKIGTKTVKGVIFSSIYCKNNDVFNTSLNDTVYAQVQKDDKGGFVLKRVLKDLQATKAEKNRKLTADVAADFDSLLDRIAM